MNRIRPTLIALMMLSTVTFARPYQSVGLTMDIPNDWQLTGESPNWVSMVATPQLATISITRYVPEMGQVPTPGAFQRKRAAIYFDGWMNLYTRDSAPTENLPAQAAARRISAYGKFWLNEQNKPVRRIVIEHYLVKPPTTFVISIDVMESNWKKIENSVKQFIQTLQAE